MLSEQLAVFFLMMNPKFGPVQLAVGGPAPEAGVTSVPLVTEVIVVSMGVALLSRIIRLNFTQF
jgi:hypothetical protein